MAGLAAVCLLSTPAGLIGGSGWSLVLFYVVAAGAMGGFAIFFSLAQDVEPRQTVRVLGVCGATSWLVISGATLVVGRIAGPATYPYLFVAIGCVPLIAAAAVLGWPEPPPTPPVRVSA